MCVSLQQLFMYFKQGNFRWRQISQKCLQDISRGSKFHYITPISFIKSYGFYFCVREILAKKAISRKMQKNFPTRNFHIYSTFYCA